MKKQLLSAAVVVTLAFGLAGCAQTTEQKVQSLALELMEKTGTDVSGLSQEDIDEGVDGMIDGVDQTCDLEDGLVDLVLDNTTRELPDGISADEFGDLFHEVRDLVCDNK